MAVHSTLENGIARIVLDWPAVHNALGPDEAGQIRRAIEAAGGDAAATVILIVSTGPSFCSGGHIPALVDLVKNNPGNLRNAVYTEFQGMIRAIEDSPLPVIAAVDGPAIGLGADLSLAGDVTFVGSKGWMKQGWMKLGLVPATGGNYLIARRAGRQAIWRYLTSERIAGPEGEAMGLCIAAENAEAAAIKMCAKLAAMPPGRVKAMRALSRLDTDLPTHWAKALDYQVDYLIDSYFVDGAEALLAKPPRGGAKV
jgi:enoyl-CoA hydratase/carnithine racemase